MEDRFGIVSFSSETTLASPALIERSNIPQVDTIKGWISALSADGSTNIHEALLTGLSFFEASENPLLLVLLTDGLPTAGITDITQIREDFHAANVADVSLFTLGFGNDVNFQFLGAIARENSGEAYKIEEGTDAAEQITNFYESVSTPILKNINLVINSGVVNNVVYPYFIPNLFEGSEIFLVGERRAGEVIHLTISGVSSVGQQNYQLSLSTSSSTNIEDSWIETTWAIAKIDDLLRRIEYGDTADETIALVTSMALDYGIVTPYTAIFIDTLEFENPEEVYDYAATSYTYMGTGPQRASPGDLLAADGSASLELFPVLASLILAASVFRFRRRK
jgi:hypothetical protein